ncbi:ABC transporter permease [Bacillus sp. FJAT-27245]|uniref:ABC transporter permease n=1 Tax=Bacillus sp. FJAT-27245 TaxID=1684144 RepID=UPI0006A7BD86|nr:ABC transporter permease [Bacillus sp. FJAT-27245]
MFSILQSEWYKLLKSRIMSIVFAGPILSFLLGVSIPERPEFADFNKWFLTLNMMNLTYSLLFLPLFSGVLASMICRYEHQAGGWKQYLTLPVTRGQVFVAKYILILLVILFIQLFYLAAIYAVGMVKGYPDPFPMGIVWKSIFGGWVATFPLVALQLWTSIIWKSFAAPFTVNVLFTLPAILAVNSERFGPYYPWGQPFLMMYACESGEGVFIVPWEQLLVVVGGSFLVFFIAGYWSLQKKAF